MHAVGGHRWGSRPHPAPRAARGGVEEEKDGHRTAALLAPASGEMGRERVGKSRGCGDSPARGTEGEGAVASGEIESER